MNNSKRLRRMMIIAMLASVATILMQFNFPLPALPPFLKVDFGEIPAVLAVMTLGPAAGIAVELIKNLLHWFLSGSPTGVPVGEIANFATGVLFILPIYYIYNKFRTAKGLTTGLIAGTVSMAVYNQQLMKADFHESLDGYPLYESPYQMQTLHKSNQSLLLKTAPV